jgi:hypothetical protein
MRKAVGSTTMKCLRHGMRIFGVAYRALAIAAALMSVSMSAFSADFSVVNASNVPLRHVYLSPCGARQWGPDQLAEALPPSRLATILGIAPGCYDIQFIVDPWNNCVIAGASLQGSTVWKVTRWTVFGSQSSDCSHVAAYVPTRRQPWVWPSAASPR